MHHRWSLLQGSLPSSQRSQTRVGGGGQAAVHSPRATGTLAVRAGVPSTSPPLLVLCCCVTNPKLRTAHVCYIVSAARSLGRLSWSSAQGLPRLHSRCEPAMSFRDLGSSPSSHVRADSPPCCSGTVVPFPVATGWVRSSFQRLRTCLVAWPSQASPSSRVPLTSDSSLKGSPDCSAPLPQ